VIRRLKMARTTAKTTLAKTELTVPATEFKIPPRYWVDPVPWFLLNHEKFGPEVFEIDADFRLKEIEAEKARILAFKAVAKRARSGR
jgi:hypothetical protein